MTRCLRPSAPHTQPCRVRLQLRECRGADSPLSGRLCFKRSEGEVAEHEAVPVLASHLRPRVPGVRPGGHLTLTPHTWTSGRIKRHRGNRCTGVTEDTSRSRAVDSR